MAIHPNPIDWANGTAGGTPTSAENLDRPTVMQTEDTEGRIAAARIIAKAEDIVTYAAVGTPETAARARASQIIETPAVASGFGTSGVGTMVASTASRIVGDYGYHVVCTSAMKIVKTIASLDLTGKHPVIWVRCDDVSTWRSFQVVLETTADNGYWFTVKMAGAGSLANGPEWIAVTVPWASATVVGTPTRSNITRIRLESSPETGTTADFWLGGIGLVAEPAAGCISFTFDDGRDNNYTTALPILSKYGIPATEYVVRDLIDLPGSLTLAQVREMHWVHGWEIAAHGGSNNIHVGGGGYTAQTEEWTANDMATLRSWLVTNGFGSGANHLAYPQGLYNDAVVRQARRNFATARTTRDTQTESYPPGDPMRLRCYEVGVRTVAQAKAQIDLAVANKTWLILLFHTIDSTNGAATATSYPASGFDQIAAYAAASGMPIRTIGQAVAAVS